MTDTIKISRELLERIVTGATCNATISEMEAGWNGIQELRQLLAQPSEPQGGEEVEVVGYRHRFSNQRSSPVITHYSLPPVIPLAEWHEPEPLMTVAQHRRLMAEQRRHAGKLAEALITIKHANSNGPVSENNGACIRRIEQIAGEALAVYETERSQ